MENKETDTDADTDTDGGNGMQSRAPIWNLMQPAKFYTFVSTVIVAAMDGGKDSPIEISSGDEDVDQR